MNKITKITTIAVLSSLPFVAGATTKVKSLGNGLYVPDYTDAELKQEGCDPKVWQQLVNQYVKARGIKKATEEESRKQIQLETPKNEFEGCFSNAIKKIDNLRKLLNKKWSIFSGDFDIMEAGIAVLEKYIEEGCRQINKATGDMVGGVTGQVTDVINTTEKNFWDEIDDATYNTGFSDELKGTGVANDESLLGDEAITMGTIIGDDNVKKIPDAKAEMRSVLDDYVKMFSGNGSEGADAGGNSSSGSGGSLLDSLLN